MVTRVSLVTRFLGRTRSACDHGQSRLPLRLFALAGWPRLACAREKPPTALSHVDTSLTGTPQASASSARHSTGHNPGQPRTPDLREMPALQTWEPLRARESLRCSISAGQNLDWLLSSVTGRFQSDTHSGTHECQSIDYMSGKVSMSWSPFTESNRRPSPYHRKPNGPAAAHPATEQRKH
jgi:hypothetical protein